MNKIKDPALWTIKAPQINPNHYFGALVANGMIGIVSDAFPMKMKSIVLNGVYDRYQRGRVSNILQGFNSLNLDLEINGRRVELAGMESYSHSLDMKRAVFKSQISAKGWRVQHEVRALRNLPYTAMVQVEIQADEDLELTLFNNIIAPDHLREVQKFYSEIDRPHVKIPLLTSVAKSPSGALKLAVSNSYIFEESHGNTPALIHEDWDFNRHLIKFSKKLKAGVSYRFSIVSSFCTSVHFSDPQNEAERFSLFAKLEGDERLIQQHEQAWEELWESDIEITGDPSVQRDMRLMLYYLYASVREGTALSLSPVGLSGLGYNGHVFWDTELWMYPPLLVMQPALARSILDYRFERLEAARKNAFAHGYKGVMFPWESADDGTEQTPVWALTGPFQQHITACIGWAFWKYYQVTKDKEWLKEKGYIVLKEVAEFWCSRVERKGPGQFEINNVIGANEFEENIDNNAFTNGIVITVLKYAIKAAEVLGLNPNPDWAEVAANIPILKFEDGTTKENRTYNGAEIKQADANLLAHPIGLIRDKEQIQKDLNYYEPRMSPNGPAMGVSTLATLHAQLGNLEQAYQLFLKSYQPNGLPPFNVLAECAGGKGVSPYFTTGAGGTLQTILFGFGGLAITDEGINQGKQHIPKKLGTLTIKMRKK